VAPTKVIVREIDRQHIVQVIPLFRKAIRQSRKAAHRHSHCQILSFNHRGRDILFNRIAYNPFLFATCASGWTVSRYVLCGGVSLDNLSVMSLIAQNGWYGVLIACKRIGRDLKDRIRIDSMFDIMKIFISKLDK